MDYRRTSSWNSQLSPSLSNYTIAEGSASTSKQSMNTTSSMDRRTRYQSCMSRRDYQYFDTYSIEDQAVIIEEAIDRVHEDNVKRLKDCVQAASITQMLGIVSHELRTPLNAIVGTIDLMRSDNSSIDQQLCIQSLELGSENLQSVMNRLQDLAALFHDQPGVNTTQFDIVAVITGVGEFRQDRGATKMNATQVTMELDPKLPLAVQGDLTKIQQILTNIVTTAISSSSEHHACVNVKLLSGGPIVSIEFKIHSLSTERPPPYLDGIGLDFNPETLLRPAHDNNNIYQGLVISREFLNLLGSRLHTTWDESTRNLLFSFTLSFATPLSPGGQRGLDNQSNYGDLVKHPEIVKVLLVEDNPVNMRIAKAILKRLGFGADTAENGLQAISKLHQQEFDIVFMDCDMPLCNGYDATSHIRKEMHNNEVIIVALTADSTNAAKNRCIAAGMNDFFLKPITTKTMDEMLHKWLKTTRNDGKKGVSRMSIGG